MNILIVEDNVEFLNTIVEELKVEGHSVITGCDGGNGFKLYKLNKNWVDLIITDYQMPFRNWYSIVFI